MGPDAVHTRDDRGSMADSDTIRDLERIVQNEVAGSVDEAALAGGQVSRLSEPRFHRTRGCWADIDSCWRQRC